ncbi:MAG: hypothetical protein BJ554DRAFT_6710, partial [Olpidium bornovanus]
VLKPLEHLCANARDLALGHHAVRDDIRQAPALHNFVNDELLLGLLLQVHLLDCHRLRRADLISGKNAAGRAAGRSQRDLGRRPRRKHRTPNGLFRLQPAKLGTHPWPIFTRFRYSRVGSPVEQMAFNLSTMSGTSASFPFRSRACGLSSFGSRRTAFGDGTLTGPGGTGFRTSCCAGAGFGPSAVPGWVGGGGGRRLRRQQGIQRAVTGGGARRRRISDLPADGGFWPGRRSCEPGEEGSVLEYIDNVCKGRAGTAGGGFRPAGGSGAALYQSRRQEICTGQSPLRERSRRLCQTTVNGTAEKFRNAAAGPASAYRILERSRSFERRLRFRRRRACRGRRRRRRRRRRKRLSVAELRPDVPALLVPFRGVGVEADDVKHGLRVRALVLLGYTRVGQQLLPLPREARELARLGVETDVGDMHRIVGGGYLHFESAAVVRREQVWSVETRRAIRNGRPLRRSAVYSTAVWQDG